MGKNSRKAHGAAVGLGWVNKTTNRLQVPKTHGSAIGIYTSRTLPEKIATDARRPRQETPILQTPRMKTVPVPITLISLI
jgi:hypothetical protein